MPRPTSLVLTTVLALAMAPWSTAQPTTPRRIGGPTRRDNAQPVNSTLYMVVQVTKDKAVPPSLVREAIIDARDELNKQAKQAGQPPVCEFETPVIRMITESIFREFSAFADQDEERTAPDEKSDKVHASRVRLQPVPSRDSLWEFDLNAGEPARSDGAERDLLVLQELIITRKSGKTDPPYKPVRLAEAKPSDDLRMVLPGSYVLKLDMKDPPVRYEIKAEGIVSGKKESIKEDWPESDQFFVMVLGNFRGDRKRLFEAVKAKEKDEPGIRVTNPLDDVRLDRDFLLTFASVGVKLQIAPPEFEAGKYLPTMPTIPKRDPRRAWILFPLTRKEVEAELAKLPKDSAELSEFIHKSNPSLASREPELEVKPGMAPRWIELPPTPDGQRFRRELTIKDYKGLQAALPEAWRLEVYEGDAGERSRAIFVGHPDRPRDGVFAAEHLIQNWPGAIEKGVKDDELAKKKAETGQ